MSEGARNRAGRRTRAPSHDRDGTSLRCPRCRTGLVPENAGAARISRCVRCRGVAVNLAVLRQFAPRERVRALWANLQAGRPGVPCASCGNASVAADVHCGATTVELDTCRACQLLWCDADELAAFSPRRQTAPRPPAPPQEPAPGVGMLAGSHRAPGVTSEGVIGGTIVEVGVESVFALLCALLD